MVHQMLGAVLNEETLTVVGRSLGLFVYSMQRRAAGVADYPEFEQDVKMLSIHIVQFIGYVVLVLSPGNERIRAVLKEFPFIEGQLAVMLLSPIRYIADPPQLEYDWGYALPEWYLWAERRVILNPVTFQPLVAKIPINGLWLTILGVQLPPQEHLALAEQIRNELEQRVYAGMVERWGRHSVPEDTRTIELGDAPQEGRDAWWAEHNDEFQMIIHRQKETITQEIKEAQQVLEHGGDISQLPTYLTGLSLHCG